MALLLVRFGFEEKRVFVEMGQAEFMYHFYTCLKLLARERQLQSSMLISSVGTFFLKKGQKTILEELNEDMLALDEIFGITKTEEKDKKVRAHNAFNKLLAGLTKLNNKR